MEAAASNGYINMVRLMLSHGANNFNHSMVAAADYGHIEIVRLMLSHGATDFNNAMEAAASNDYQNIVYLDANDLYGLAMSMPQHEKRFSLSTSKF